MWTAPSPQLAHSLSLSFSIQRLLQVRLAVYKTTQKHTFFVIFLFLMNLQLWIIGFLFTTSKWSNKFLKNYKVSLLRYLKNPNFFCEGVWPYLQERPTKRPPFWSRRNIQNPYTCITLYKLPPMIPSLMTIDQGIKRKKSNCKKEP